MRDGRDKTAFKLPNRSTMATSSHDSNLRMLRILYLRCIASTYIAMDQVFRRDMAIVNLFRKAMPLCHFEPAIAERPTGAGIKA